MNSIYFEIANYFIDFTFLVDIMIAFRTVYIDDTGNEIEEPSMIFKNYISGQFWIDLLATIPLD